MNKEVKDYQDNMVNFLINAKLFEDQSGFGIAIIKDSSIVPINNLLKGIHKATTREDLKLKIEKALDDKSS